MTLILEDVKSKWGPMGDVTLKVQRRVIVRASRVCIEERVRCW